MDFLSRTSASVAPILRHCDVVLVLQVIDKVKEENFKRDGAHSLVYTVAESAQYIASGASSFHIDAGSCSCWLAHYWQPADASLVCLCMSTQATVITGAVIGWLTLQINCLQRRSRTGGEAGGG